MSEGNGLNRPEPRPCLSNGKKVLFAFVEDSENGVELVCFNDLNLIAARSLALKAYEHFGTQWCQVIEKRLFETEKPPVLVGLDGSKLA